MTILLRICRLIVGDGEVENRGQDEIENLPAGGVPPRGDEDDGEREQDEQRRRDADSEWRERSVQHYPR